MTNGSDSAISSPRNIPTLPLEPPPGARHEQRAASALRKRIDFMFASLICGFPGSPGRSRRRACGYARAAVIGAG